MDNQSVSEKKENLFDEGIFRSLGIPSIAKSFKEVYALGSIPLILIFVAAVIVFRLLVVNALTSLSYLVAFLITAGVAVFLIINLLAYRRWRDEVNARLENRRLEMELYTKLVASARETQDGFILSVLKYLSEIANKSDTSPEGRKLEIESLSKSLGSLVKDFVDIRANLELPELTNAMPRHESSETNKEVAKNTKQGFTL